MSIYDLSDPPPPLPNGNGDPTPPQNKWGTLGKQLPIGFSILYVLLLLVSLIKQLAIGGIHWWVVVVGVATWHFGIMSIHVIREYERAVLVFFGLILKEWGSGPHFALWPFYYVRRATRNSVQVDFGTIDEKSKGDIERAKKAELSVSWYVMEEPVRINWGDMRSLGLPDDECKAYANDPYALTLTTDPHLYFRVRISNLQTLIEEIGGLDEAMERIKDVCIRTLSEYAGQTFVAKARKELASLSEKMKERVEDLVGDPEAVSRARVSGKRIPRSWGLDIEEVGIKDVGTPYDTNKATALRGAAIAKADGDAQATIRTAQASRIKLEEEGQGQASATRTKADAERHRLTQEGAGVAEALELQRIAQALGFRHLADASNPETAALLLRLEAFERAVKEGNVTILPIDQSILTSVLSLKETLMATKPPGSN